MSTALRTGFQPAPVPTGGDLAAAAPLVLHTRVVADSGGGPEKTILRSAGYARQGGLRMAAAYMRPADGAAFEAVRQQARQWDCTLYEIPERGPLDPRCVSVMLQLCRQYGVNVWHAHDYKSNLLGLVLRRQWPMKLVTTVHGWTWHTFRTRLYYHLDNWCLKRYDQVIAVSPKLFDHCLMRGVRHERLSHVANGVDTGEYTRRQTIEQARAALGIGPDRFVIGVVGRLSVEKGADRAVAAIAALRKGYANVQLHLIGDGPAHGELAALAAAQGVDDAVRFWGWQGDARSYYEAMDMLLLPSRTEGLPNAVLEAMSMQVPVAATNVGGVRDLLEAGRCGVILNDDVSTWPGHIAPLIVSEDRRREMARRARQRIEEHFTFDARMKKVFTVYERVLGRTFSVKPATARRTAA